MLHRFRISTSRQDNLHPYAQVVSRLSVSIIIFYFLKNFFFKNTSHIPAVVLTIMVAASLKPISGKPTIQGGSMSFFSSSIDRSNRASILSAVAALDAYKDNIQAFYKRRYALFSKMSLTHQNLAQDTGYLDRLNAMELSATKNAKVAKAIAQYAKKKYSIKEYELRVVKPLSNGSVIELLNHYVRDWSNETANDRKELFRPILNNLQKEFPESDRSDKKILVPGSGLARLAYEISLLNFKTDAYEYSHLMDIGAQFLYRYKKYLPASQDHFDLYPFVHDFSHQSSTSAQLRSISIPSIKDLSQPKNLHLDYGDFTKLAKSNPSEYDSVVTLFLIDTAENTLHYLDSIRDLVKPGGIWINYGPLKWGTAPQVEFNLEELKQVITKFDFVIEDEFEGDNEYNGDKMSLWQGKYRIRGWVARRKESSVNI